MYVCMTCVHTYGIPSTGYGYDYEVEDDNILAKLKKKILSSFGHQLHSSGMHIRYGYELNMTSLYNNSSPQRRYYLRMYNDACNVHL